MTTASRNRSSAASSMNTRTGVFIAIGLLVAAVIVALIVSLASGGDDSSGALTNEAARIPSGSIRQVSFVETRGDSLPRFDGTELIDPAVGAIAPTITASYFDGGEALIDTADGTPRVLLFLAHWCPHCQAEVRSLSDWFEANGSPTEVQVVAISTNVDEGAPNYPPSAWFLREGWTIPVVRDSAQNDLAAGYGLSSFPYAVVVSGDGEIISRSSGSLTTTQWEMLLESALAS